MRLSYFILFFVLATICSCNVSRNSMETTSSNATDKQNDTTCIKYVATYNDISFALFDKAQKLDKKENICISPASTMWTLSMLANGANGNTLNQITDLLGTDSINKLNREQELFIKNLAECDTNIKLSIANSIWINEKLNVKPAFIATNEKFYDATVCKRAFDNNTLTAINRWCSEKTNGKIDTIINKLESNTLMLLLNALYFKAMWNKPFNEDATTLQTFTKEDGEEINVDMMSQKLRTSYFENDTVQIVSKPFANGEFEMLFILPCKNRAVSEVSSMLYTDFSRWYKNMQEGTNVILEVPKFKTEYETSLKEILRQCGITDSFGSKADFSLISDNPLYVDDIIQKNYISVNEYGAEAAAVTIASMQLLSARPTEHKTVKLNRPFVFAITESLTGENRILFMGKIGEPNNK